MKDKGMTLIELLLVLAIIAVLASLVYPSYSRTVLEGHRKLAQTDMARIQLQLEQQYQAGYQLDGIMANGLCVMCSVDSQRYQITVTAGTHSYQISATPQSASGQNQDQCAGQSYSALTLTHSGDMQPAACWR